MARQHNGRLRKQRAREERERREKALAVIAVLHTRRVTHLRAAQFSTVTGRLAR
jgi:hypothetical protein